MNLIEKVYQEMSTDADGNDKQAVILKKEYIDATQDQQQAIDRVFIALCGWSVRGSSIRIWTHHCAKTSEKGM
jgi:hypothetical protein